MIVLDAPIEFCLTMYATHFCLVMESSFSSTPGKQEIIPDWVVVGESVLIRPYNTSGVIAFVGVTHFQVIVFSGYNTMKTNSIILY